MGNCVSVDSFIGLKVSYTIYIPAISGIGKNHIALSQVVKEVSTKLFFAATSGSSEGGPAW